MTAGKRDPKEPEDRARPGPAKVRDAPAPTGDAALDALLGRLTRTGHGAVAATSANVADVLRLHPAWKGVLGFNTRASCPVFLRRPPFRFWDDSLTFPVELHDRHKGDLAEWLARSFEAPFSVNPKTALEELDRACREAPFEPLIDHLRGLKWSGECLLDTWLSRYGHAADTPFNRAAGRKWMISSVARAMQPGCKADHVLVFEGPEAAKKSTALETLAYADTHSEWHTDQLPDLENKDSMVQLQGPWIVEMGELATVRKARREKLKAFVSSRVDRFRPPHATLARNFPRRCIFAGTTNETNYFDDPTGNRRFWPVHTPSWDIEALKRDRDQLWAEAVAAFDAGEAWHLDAELEAAARVVQDSRSVDDLWSDRIEAWIGGQETVSVTDCLGELGITEDRRTPTDARRIEGILRRAGWRAYGNQERRGKYKVRLWTAPRTDDAEHVEPVVEVEHVQGVEPVRVVELVQGVEPVVEPVRVVEPDADDETVAAMADDLADDEDRAARTRTATGIGLQSPTAATG
jgi:predicted P-loop ATPase